MASEAERDKLVQLLCKYLDDGVTVCSDTRFFADSVLGLGVDEVGAVLADPGSDHRHELLMLVFSPSDRLRLDVERILAAACFSEADGRHVAAHIAERLESVRFRMDDTGQGTAIPVDSDVIQLLVDRLAMHRQLDDTVCAALKDGTDEQRQLAARVVMRIRNVPITAGSRELLCRFIGKAGTDEPAFFAMFDMLILLAGEISGREVLDDYLYEKRRLLIKTLQDLDTFARRKEQHGMEYLLMHRYPIPHESEDEARRQLALLDRVMVDLLGMDRAPELALLPEEPAGSGLTPADEELAALLRTLS